MRIGIVPILNAEWGGIYQYSLNALQALDQLKDVDRRDEFILLVDEKNHPALAPLIGQDWTVKPFSPPPSQSERCLNIIRRAIGEGPHREAWRWLRKRVQRLVERPASLPNPEIVQYQPELAAWWRKQGVDLMFYPAATTIAFEVGIPYIVVVHDLQHRLHPEFLEVSARGEWERREYRFRNCIRHATLVIADSDVGKEDILYFYGPYGAIPERIKVLPLFPPCYLSTDVCETERRRVQEKYKLPKRYLFYPAQFWPHKNHGRVLQALERLKKIQGLEIPVVFCGTFTGDLPEQYFRLIMNMAQQCGIAQQVHYLGHIPNEDMSALYITATALVIPTLFGTASIPPLEAWAYGCPVLTSDIPGIREQVGDAGLLVSPRSIESIAEGTRQLWVDEDLRRGLAERGRRRLTAHTSEDFRRGLEEILGEAKDLARLRMYGRGKGIGE